MFQGTQPHRWYSINTSCYYLNNNNTTHTHTHTHTHTRPVTQSCGLDLVSAFRPGPQCSTFTATPLTQTFIISTLNYCNRLSPFIVSLLLSSWEI